MGFILEWVSCLSLDLWDTSQLVCTSLSILSLALLTSALCGVCGLSLPVFLCCGCVARLTESPSG